MGIYVASRASIPARGAMWRDLRRGGWPIISSWIDEDGQGQTKSMRELWYRIGHEIDRASHFILYAADGDLPLKGALIEAGMALSRNIPVFVVLPGIKEPERLIGSWINHPLVTIKETVGEALHATWGRE